MNAVGTGIRTLRTGFLLAAERHPDRPALEVLGRTLTYAELRTKAASVAATLAKRPESADPPLTAVFAARSETAFVGVLGALLAGDGYVPLNPNYPPERSRRMLERSACRSIIVDAESVERFNELMDGVTRPMLIIVPDLEDVSSLARRLPNHTVVGATDLVDAGAWVPVDVAPDAIAYLLFTSGSTGVPKGVMVSHANVISFIDVMVERYGITEVDRFSQTFDLTFDLSVFDMFVCWERGACLCCPTAKTLLNPGNFIRESSISVWFSVPSSAIFMRRFGSLKPDQYPELRWSLFCGEPLPAEVARVWSLAASSSTLENLYGPTEVTIACMVYRWHPTRSEAECQGGLVPIGDPLPSTSALVVDADLNEVESGAEGQLLMCGPQVTVGYWQDDTQTQAAFLRLPGNPGFYYATGDRVRKPSEGRPMHYLGRMDHQIKILGHRVELGEVEAVLREESGADVAIALGWPRTPSGANALVAFVADEKLDADDLLARVGARLPHYMVPRTIHLKYDLPLNANGKTDRNALAKLLEGME